MSQKPVQNVSNKYIWVMKTTKTVVPRVTGIKRGCAMCSNVQTRRVQSDTEMYQKTGKTQKALTVVRYV